VFRPRCGRERQGGEACKVHDWAKVPVALPKEVPVSPVDWEGTSLRVPTELDFQSTYEQDVKVFCAVIMSNTFVRLGLAPLDLSDWATARFQELTNVGWKAPKADVKHMLIDLGYYPEDGP
jgi:hypothetical protein